MHPTSLLAFTAGDWHAVPFRVMAKQRGAFMALCMGLFVRFFILTPCLNGIGNNGLAATVN